SAQRRDRPRSRLRPSPSVCAPAPCDARPRSQIVERNFTKRFAFSQARPAAHHGAPEVGPSAGPSLGRRSMTGARGSRSAELRQRLDHPVIDGDGHTIEYDPLFFEYLAEVGGPKMVERYHRLGTKGGVYYSANDAERVDRRLARIPYWGNPSRNTYDR